MEFLCVCLNPYFLFHIRFFCHGFSALKITPRGGCQTGPRGIVDLLFGTEPPDGLVPVQNDQTGDKRQTDRRIRHRGADRIEEHPEEHDSEGGRKRCTNSVSHPGHLV